MKSCLIDFPITRAYADFYYMFALASAFLLLIPAIIYLFLGVVLTEGFAWIAGRFERVAAARQS